MVIVFTDLARDDLVAIEKYTRKKWGRDQADAYLTQIEDRIIGLLKTPYIGRPRPDVAEGYRCLPEGKHIIFYRVDINNVYIIGIPHASMDLEKHLE